MANKLMSCPIILPWDRQYASANNTSVHAIAALRHYYEQTTGDLVEPNNKDYVEKLLPFKNTLTKEKLKQINDSILAGESMTFARALTFLGEEFSNEEIRWMQESAFGIIETYLDGVVTLVRAGKNNSDPTVARVAAFKEKYGFEPTRAEILQDFITLPELCDKVVKTIGSNIMMKSRYIQGGANMQWTQRDRVLHRAISRRAADLQNIDNATTPAAEDYISSIVWLIKNQLKKAEGIEIGTRATFKISFEEDPSSLKGAIDIEESPKEHYLVKDEKTDPFKKVTQRVRSVLYRVPRYVVDENGVKVPDADSLGIPLFESNVTIHKKLLGLFRHCQNQDQFRDILNKASNNDKQIAFIKDLCDKDPQFLQDLVISYRGTNIRYRGIKIKEVAGEVGRAVSTFFYGAFLNHLSTSQYTYRIKNLRNDFTGSIYKMEEGKPVLDATKFAEFREYIQSKVEYDYDNPNHVKIIASGIEGYNVRNALDIIKNINTFLNLGLKERELEYVINNIAQFKTIIKNAYIISDYEFTEGSDLANVTSFFNSNVAGYHDKRANIKNSLNALFAATQQAIQSYSSSRVRVNDSDYMADVSYNKFASIIDTVRYAKSLISQITAQDNYDNSEIEEVLSQLRNYLRNNYLSSSEYAELAINPDGTIKLNDAGEPVYKHIYNQWLNLLYNTNAVTSNKVTPKLALNENYQNSVFNASSLFNNIEVIRTLTQADTINAEDFTESQNLTAMIANYFAINKNDSSTGLADYTLFTMGDSGAYKTITAPRYSGKELIEQFKLLAIQEIRRMTLQSKIKIAYTNNGTRKEDLKGITSMAVESGVYNKFTLLPFLNTFTLNFGGEYLTVLDVINRLNTEKLQAIQNIREKDPTSPLIKEISKQYSSNIVKILDVALSGSNKDNPTEIISAKGPILVIANEGALQNYFQEAFWNKVEHQDQFQFGENDTVFPKFSRDNKGILISTKMPTNMTETNDLRNFFLNSVLANAYTFQFNHFTPDLFPSSTQHQKREKATNTPGVAANINAVDKQGKLYSKDGIERVQYFKEFTVSLENEDPKLWTALQKTFPTDTADPILNAKNKGILNIYKKIKSTDGQGFRTLASYRKVLGMTGKWTDKMEVAYQELNAIRAVARKEHRMLTAEELTEIDALNMVFQPIKPHFCGAEKIYVDPEQMKLPLKERQGDFMFIGVEHKYAEVILIPEMFPVGSLRRTLGEYMENPEGLIDYDPADGIDLICSEECVKAGKWGAIDIRSKVNKNNEYVNDKGEIVSKEEEAMAASLIDATNSIYGSDIVAQLRQGITHQFEYSDYTIQNETPEHIKAAQLFGTQIRKHVMDALLSKDGGLYNLFETLSQKKIKSFKFNGVTYDLTSDQGRNGVLVLYNALICTAINNSLQDTVSSIQDPSTLAPILSALKANDINSIFEDHLKFSLTTNEDGEATFKYPIAEGFGLYDVEAALTSIFKKNVNKQKINGGSAVQMTDAGLFADGYKLKCHIDSIGNVTKTECAMAWNLSYYNSKGKEVALQFSDYCHADGTLIGTGIYINEETNEKVSKEEAIDENGVLKDGYYELSKLEKEFPGILDLVAYRIPTERDYSILNLRVVRFLPKIAGGVMAVPSAFIAAAGFDFDIDKLYYFRKEYREKREFTNTSSPSIVWQDIYNISINEDGTIDDSNASEIYRRLYAQRVLALANHVNDNSKNLFAGKNIEVLNQMFPNLKDAPKLQDNLYKYWEAAGLNKDYHNPDGSEMTYTDYYNQYITTHSDKYKNVSPEERFIGYNSEIDPRDQHTTAINNMIIEIIQSRLSDPKTMPIRFTPGGFVNSKIASRIIKGLLNPELNKSFEELLEEADSLGLDMPDYDQTFDAVNPLTTCIFNERNSIASKTIGIFANHSTNMVYSQALYSMSLKTDKEISMMVNGKLAKYSDLIHNEDGKLYIAELLAASVDAVKDPVLNFLNINTYTANTAALMARLGINPLQIGLFLNQPVIKDVVAYMANNGMRDLNKGIRRYYRERYKSELPSDPITDFSFTDINTLAEGIKGHTQNGRAVLRYFYQISQEAQALSDFIGKTKFTAANTVENSLGGMFATIVSNRLSNSKQSLLSETIDFTFNMGDQELNLLTKQQSSPIIFNDKVSAKYMRSNAYWKMLANHPMAFEQVMHDSMLSFVKSLSKYFPYFTPTYSAIYHTLFDNSFKSTISKNLIDKINYTYPLYRMQHLQGYNFTEDYFNGLAPNPRDARFKEGTDVVPVSNAEYYTKTFPLAMSEILGRRTDIVSLITLSNEISNTNQKADLLNQAKQEYKSLQEDYGYLSNISFEEFTTNKLLDMLKVIVNYEDVDLSQADSEEEAEEIRLKEAKTYIGFTDGAHFNTDNKIDFSSAWESLFGLDKLRGNEYYAPHESLAGMLVMYNFFSGGFNAGVFNFGNLIPRRILDHLAVGKMENNLVSYMKAYKDTLISNYDPADPAHINEYLLLLYANSSNEYDIVKSIAEKDMSVNSHGSIRGTGFPSGILSKDTNGYSTITFKGVKSTGPNSNAEEILLPKDKGESGVSYLIPAFKYKGKLYILATKNNNVQIRTNNVLVENSDVIYREIPIRNGSDFSPLNMDGYYSFNAQSTSNRFMTEVYFQNNTNITTSNQDLRKHLQEEIQRLCEEMGLCGVAA